MLVAVASFVVHHSEQKGTAKRSMLQNMLALTATSWPMVVAWCASRKQEPDRDRATVRPSESDSEKSSMLIEHECRSFKNLVQAVMAIKEPPVNTYHVGVHLSGQASSLEYRFSFTLFCAAVSLAALLVAIMSR